VHQAQGRLAVAGGTVELGGPGGQHARSDIWRRPIPEASPPLLEIARRSAPPAPGMGGDRPELSRPPSHPQRNPFHDLRGRILRLHEQNEGVLRAMGQDRATARVQFKAGEIPESLCWAELDALTFGMVGDQRRRRNNVRSCA